MKSILQFISRVCARRVMNLKRACQNMLLSTERGKLPMRASSIIKISLEFQNYLCHKEMCKLAGLSRKRSKRYFLLVGFL